MKHFAVRIAMLSGIVALVVFCAGSTQGQQASASPKYLVVDTHNDTAQRVLIENVDLGHRTKDGTIDLPRLREGGVLVPFFALWVPTYYKGSTAVRRTLDLRDAMQSVFDRNPDQIELATSLADIKRITAQKKIAAVLTAEGGHQIDNDLAVLRMYRRMGILSMTLTHFTNNDWADSSTDKEVHHGLTDFGKQVVREMNAIGMIVDVSHVSDKTFYDVLQVTSKPVIASHSSCRSISNIPRNMTDDMLRALAKNGGVVGLNFGASFLNQEDGADLMKVVSQINAAEPPQTQPELDQFAAKDTMESGEWNPRVSHATLEDAVACIDHIVKVAGIDHVGIGADFDGVPIVPIGLEDVSKMPNLASALAKRGYSEQDIQKVMSGNFLRVIGEVLGK
jgi:membrane dipeptidase